MKTQTAAQKQRFKFISDIISELKKVTWPSRADALRLTGLVIAFTIVVALILGVLDYGFSKLMDVILLR